MHFLYYIMPDRRLQQVVDGNGNHVCAVNREQAGELAKPYSFNYPVTLDRDSDLHNTRDGKKVTPVTI